MSADDQACPPKLVEGSQEQGHFVEEHLAPYSRDFALQEENPR